jgi:hypothetical protein
VGTRFATGQTVGLAESVMACSEIKTIIAGGEDSVASGIYADVLKGL